MHLARASRHCMSTSLKLLREGLLTPEHIRAIERGIRNLPDQHQEPAVLMLNEAAERVDVEGLRQLIRHLAHAADPDGSARIAKQMFNRRRMHLSPMLDGMVALDAVLDPEGAATVSAALEPFLVPSGSSDSRSTPQRRADGLVELARVAMSQALLGVSGGATPNVNVLCTMESLRGETRAADRGGAVIGGGAVVRGRAQLGFTRTSDVVSGLATPGVAFLTAGFHQHLPMRITSSRGKTAVRRISSMGCWSAASTTASCMKATGVFELNRYDECGRRYADANQTLTFYRSSVIRGVTRLTSEPANIALHQLRCIAWWSNAPPVTS